MGKFESQLPVQQQQQQQQQQNHGGLCPGCSMGLSRIGRLFSFKCLFVLLLSFALFLSAIFLLIPSRSRQSGFDARDSIKLSASVQASFKLQKPTSLLVPQIPRLEYDITGEIGVPYSKVVILSIHQAGASNWSYVVFGVLSDPVSSPINAVSLSVLRSSLIELFLQQTNLTLTTSFFGQPSSFEILKFPGGITVIPEPSVVWSLPQILFNFTLPNSIKEIKENCVELKNQLKLGLRLKDSENVYVQVTNKHGSSKDSPVTVQASVLSDLRVLVPQRLKQLAQTITGSPAAKNLGLNNTVFGKVKEIILSSYLNSTLHALPPTPSPAPSPEQNDYAGPSIPPSPHISPSYLPAPVPCLNCDASSPLPDNMPHHSLPPVSNSPAPSEVDSQAPSPGPHCGLKISPSPSPVPPDKKRPPALPPHASAAVPPPTGSRSEISPSLSPLPSVSYGSRPVQDKGNGKGPVPPPVDSPSALTSSSSSTASPQTKQFWFLCFLMLTTSYILGWCSK